MIARRRALPAWQANRVVFAAVATSSRDVRIVDVSAHGVKAHMQRRKGYTGALDRDVISTQSFESNRMGMLIASNAMRPRTVLGAP